MQVNIQFNKDIISKLKEHEIYPDISGSVMFVLIAIAENKIELLDHADDMNKARKMFLLYTFLERRGFLYRTDNSEFIAYNLTAKGVSLVKYLKEAFNDELSAESFIEERVIVEEESVDNWALEYVSLFPRHKTAHEKTIPKRFDKFFKEFPEYASKELILNATKYYIEENRKKDENLTYIREANYFIWKAENGSIVYDLATWCQKYLNKDKNETEFNMDFLNAI